jgi:hypothetical protein
MFQSVGTIRNGTDDTAVVSNFMDRGFVAPYYRIHISTSSLKVVVVGHYASLPTLI